MRQSTKIVVAFVALVGIGYGAYTVVINKAVENEHFAPVLPTQVNLVGIAPGSGYRIIVANEIAQLVQTSEKGFEGQESADSGATEGSIKKRIPMKEMLAVLRGDDQAPKALGAFAMSMNDLSENNLPPIRVTWTADDLRKALGGDKKLQAKLEDDLVTRLDGTPLDKVRPAAIENGIVIEAPVSVTVTVGGERKKITGFVLDGFKTQLVSSVEAKYADKLYDRSMQMGYYTQVAKDMVANPKRRENVRASLLERISDEASARRAEPVDRVLGSATVVVNDRHITKATSRTYDTTDGERSDLTIDLTDEGRRRLWKYSRDRVGTQLLLVADGVAIAAPRIQHVLAEGELTITQMRDKNLVEEAKKMINSHASPLAG